MTVGADGVPVIRVSAAVVTDADGRALLVRKRGATVFQQPGGKPDGDETAVEAVIRELAEEIGVRVAPEALEHLGAFSAPAANEPGHRVEAEAFAVRIDAADAARGGEIEEMRWIREQDAESTPLANLSRTHLLRFAWR